MSSSRDYHHTTTPPKKSNKSSSRQYGGRSPPPPSVMVSMSSSSTPRPSRSGVTSTSSVASSVTSFGSTAFSTSSSTYRHHFTPSTSTTTSTVISPPKSKLLTDASHKPKTRGSVGLLIVGIGSKRSTTMLAGILANRHNIHWRGPRGELMTPNYNGCLTQMIDSQQQQQYGLWRDQKIKGLANVNLAAIGGWDICSTKLGDALLDFQILDYDLVRQVQPEMNQIKFFRGLYEKRFYCSNKNHDDDCSYILTEKEARNASEALKCLRADIRYFKWRNGVVGHTTVLWNATEYSNTTSIDLTEIQTARDLLDVIELSNVDQRSPLPPSLLYATAALLEGCSFINGTSSSGALLSCQGLMDLAQQQLGVYCLGSDFSKAAQFKFHTTTVEYLRTLGLTPKDEVVVGGVSSNQSGNEKNKHDAHYNKKEENNRMYTPAAAANIMNDNNNRDLLEYTSLGFLGQTHTMVTYTSVVSDAVLCAPSMIDAAVWCDYFSSRSWPYNKVAKALAYLFRVPEGEAVNVDINPGFFPQMEELTTQAMAACHAKEAKFKKNKKDSTTISNNKSSVKKRVRIRPQKKSTEWAIPQDASIICAGLACVDMQLNQATGGDGGESIETFEGEKSIGGGSVSMACKTIARLCHGAQLDDDYMQVSPPVVHSVIPLCKIGNDNSGNKLISLLEQCGGECRNVETKFIQEARDRDANARTALAVLPIYKDGRRGCFFDAASNDVFSCDEMREMIYTLASGASSQGPSLDMSQMSQDDLELYHERVMDSTPTYGAFLFGYPHLLPKMQGEELAQIFLEARSIMEDGGIIALDLNGVPEGTFFKGNNNASETLRTATDLKNDPVIGPALEHVDILHMNEDELVLLTGCEIEGTEAYQLEDDWAIATAVNQFLLCGVAVVAVTRGKKGSFVSCNDEERFSQSRLLPTSWIDCTAKMEAMELPKGSVINTNGAGDSFTAGLLVASMLRNTGQRVPKNGRDGGRTNNEGGADGNESASDQSFDLKDLNPLTRAAAAVPDKANSNRSPPKTGPSSPPKLTPYTLYMRENYVMLKQQLNDDKKAIFSKCHEMWEIETEEVKTMYERRAKEEMEEINELSMRLDNDLEVLDSTPRNDNDGRAPEEDDDDDHELRSMYMTNRALNLESAVQFAGLVAAHHVAVSTRDLAHLDVSPLLERSMIFPPGLEEI